MIILVSWIQFQQHFAKTDKLVYVKENTESWEFYYPDGMVIIKCVVLKSETSEENFAFVDRHLNSMNIIKVDGIIESEPVRLRLVQE